jgi:hypothetical protein
MPAARRTADRRPGAGAEQATTDCTLCWVIGVSARRQRQYQARRNTAGSNRTLCHFAPLQSIAPQTIGHVSRQAVNVSATKKAYPILGLGAQWHNVPVGLDLPLGSMRDCVKPAPVKVSFFSGAACTWCGSLD